MVILHFFVIILNLIFLMKIMKGVINMSVVFENEDNEVCVILCENDYIKVMAINDDKECLVITRKNNKLNVECKENKKPSKKEERSK